MITIMKFCKEAERVYGSTTNINSLKDLTIHLDITKDEILRTRFNRDTSCIFNLELNMGHKSSIIEETKYMHALEMFYPGLFSWRFNGQSIEAIALIPMNKDILGILGRYRGIYNFIRHLRKRIADILKYRNYHDVNTTYVVQKEIIATGSINSDTDMYVVPIKPTDTPTQILYKSNVRIIEEPDLRRLNLKFWVKEINPDYYKVIPTRKTKKYKLTDDVWDKYPKCIKTISNLYKKGNYNRFLLASFFLHVHNERDAKHQLLSVLSDHERKHILSGNCKDQWRAIVSKGYPPPSCKTMIDLGFANGPQDCEGLHITGEEDSEDVEEEEHVYI